MSNNTDVTDLVHSNIAVFGKFNSVCHKVLNVKKYPFYGLTIYDNNEISDLQMVIIGA
jgi:hypothetical protein